MLTRAGTTDVTKLRKGQYFNGRKVGTCPKCGRKGAVGRDTVTHEAKFNGFFYTITDHCIITPDGKIH